MESGNSLVFLQGTKNIVRIEEVFELQGFQVMESENNLQGTKNVVRFSSYGESTVHLVKSKNKNLQSAVDSFSLNLLLCFSKNSRVPVGI